MNQTTTLAALPPIGTRFVHRHDALRREMILTVTGHTPDGRVISRYLQPDAFVDLKGQDVVSSPEDCLRPDEHPDYPRQRRA